MNVNKCSVCGIRSPHLIYMSQYGKNVCGTSTGRDCIIKLIGIMEAKKKQEAIKLTFPKPREC